MGRAKKNEEKISLPRDKFFLLAGGEELATSVDEEVVAPAVVDQNEQHENQQLVEQPEEHEQELDQDQDQDQDQEEIQQYDVEQVQGTALVKESSKRNEWQICFAALRKYAEEKGHCNVPLSETYECVLQGYGEDGADVSFTGKLGKWLGNQRTKKKSNKPLTVLGQEREAQLQELVDQGLLLWDASQRKGPRNEDDKRPFDAAWKRHFAALLKYKDQHGHCNVPIDGTFVCVLEGMGEEPGTDYTYNCKLGIWLNGQRRLKKGTHGNTRLAPEREMLLQELVDQGLLLWDASEMAVCAISKARGDYMWPKHFAALEKYAIEHGHCNVPIEAEYECLLEGLGEGGTDLHYKSKLGPWLSNQRQRHRGSKGKQKLSPEREALLQGLVDQGLLRWDVSEQASSYRSKQLGDVMWPRHYAALQKYAIEHGHCNVSQKAEYECILEGMGDDGGDLHYKGKLGVWLSSQRSMKKGKVGSLRLTPERDALLQVLVDRGILLWDATEQRGGAKVIRHSHNRLTSSMNSGHSIGHNHGHGPIHGQGHSLNNDSMHSTGQSIIAMEVSAPMDAHNHDESYGHMDLQGLQGPEVHGMDHGVALSMNMNIGTQHEYTHDDQTHYQSHNQGHIEVEREGPTVVDMSGLAML